MMNNANLITAPGADILIVEDSITQAQFLAQLLASQPGYRVRVAANGIEGLRAARLARPTLIVSDIAMPEMDGFSMCQEIKRDAQLRDVPVILLTSLNSLYDVIKGLDCGADNFIRKPFDNRYLLSRIRAILANRELRTGERVQMGMQVSLGGQTHFITAERQQIFDLLISTYEEAIQMTEELKAQQERIARSYQSLQGLYQIAEALNPTLSEQAVAAMALEHILDFPGVSGACISLFDAHGELQLAAAHGFGALAAGMACPDCRCSRQLLGGQMTAPLAVDGCELLQQAHLCIPLVGANSNRGMLALASAGPGLCPDDASVLETAAKQIAVALERAHLYEHMEAAVKERTEALQSERNLLSAIVDTTDALVCLATPDGRVVLFNQACERTFGWPAQEVLGRPLWEIFHKVSGEPSIRNFFEDAARQDKVAAQKRDDWLARDGSVRTIIWSSTGLRRPDHSVEYWLGTGIDVTKLRFAEEQLQYLSNFDVLTGLPNTILLRDRVRQLQEKAAGGNQVMGFLLLKFERLRRIRETLGIHAEQALLVQISSRLGAWNQGGDSVARSGEFSFAIAVARADVNELSLLARQLLAAMEQAFQYEQQELHLNPCIGISVFPTDGDNYDTIAQNAEVAMRRALGSVAERYAFYRPELNRDASEHFKFESALRHALERNEFLLHYQPQVSLTTGAVTGVEALIRWRHPELGLIAPARFIALAEETGLILPIGEWVLREACSQACAWQAAGLKPVPMSVNLSALQFSANIVGAVARILTETGLDPTLLELELTESASMNDPEKSIDILRRLKAMGVQLAIDDFGTGYSNLNYLKRFPVDKLKLDQSFVRDIISDPDDLAISRAVIAMAHSLRLTVIAEGVESAGQLALLADHGCDEMQGYFFSRPLEAAACEQLLREQRALPPATLQRQPYRRTLLYVDNEVNLLAAIRRSLRDKGYTVLTAASAAEAFEVLATTEVGVILCDQRMPGISGTEFLSRVKQMYPAAIRMVLSGYTDLQSVTDAVNHGAIFKFLSKPWIDQELFDAVRDGFAEFETKTGASGMLAQLR